MSTGRRRLFTSQRVARSTRVRTSSRSLVWTCGVDLVVQRPDRGVHRLRREDRPGRDLRPDHVTGAGAGLAGKSVEAGDPGLVDEVVHHDRGDDLAVQPVPRHLVGIALLQLAREVADQPVRQVGIIRQLRGEDLRLQRDLGPGHQGAQLRRGQALVGRPPGFHLLLGRQELESSVQHPSIGQPLHPVTVHMGHLRGLVHGVRQRQILRIVVDPARGRRPRRSSRQVSRRAAPS